MLLNARHSAPSPSSHAAAPCQHTSIIMLWMLWEKVDLPRPPPSAHTHTLPQPARNSELSCCCRCCCCSRNAVEVCGHILARMFLYQTRRDQTQRDQTRAEQSTPDQTRPDSCQSAGRRSWHPLLPACCHSQRFRSWQFVSNLALIFHTGHRKLKCSHNGKSLACQKWRQFSRFSKG